MDGTASFHPAFLKSRPVSVVSLRKSQQEEREGGMGVPESSTGAGIDAETYLIDHFHAAKGYSLRLEFTDEENRATTDLIEVFATSVEGIINEFAMELTEAQAQAIGIAPFAPEPEIMNAEKPSSSDTSNDTNRSKSKGLHHHPQSLLTARELHACIMASEGTRAVCSILIAILVVSSYIARPLLGVDIISSKSILAAKPLYMVLLSDLTVVFAHFVLIRRRGRLEEEEGEGWRDDELSWMRAVTVLERGLVVHQTVRAVFIDCSVYVVIVACGLSLVS